MLWVYCIFYLLKARRENQRSCICSFIHREVSRPNGSRLNLHGLLVRLLHCVVSLHRGCAFYNLHWRYVVQQGQIMLSIRHHVLLHPLLLYPDYLTIEGGCFWQLLFNIDWLLDSLCLNGCVTEICYWQLLLDLPLRLELAVSDWIVTYEVSHTFLLLLLFWH